MFDISFSELIVIFIVALIAIGPQRLPKVARTAGLLVGRAQRYLGQIKSEVSREMELERIAEIQAEMQRKAKVLESQARREADCVMQPEGTEARRAGSADEHAIHPPAQS
jgi:sec-independent protein translocase protein TatB